MTDLQLTTAGESHGPAQLAVVQGLPSGLPVNAADVDRELERRQRGYGRGGRMKIEKDRVSFVAGLRRGRTLGSPLAMVIPNRDYASWHEAMSPDPPSVEEQGTAFAPITVPRPGHADLAGAAKFASGDMRDILERSSARSTAALVAAGAVAKRFLAVFGVEVRGRVVQLGGIDCAATTDATRFDSIDWDTVEASPFGCDVPEAEGPIRRHVDALREAGDSAGGVFEVWAGGVCPGLGSHTDPHSRLDGRLGTALLSIPAIKALEIGAGLESAARRGSEVHDHIVLSDTGDSLKRPTNRAGGIEGGMTNGMPVVVRAAMKPIPTLSRPLPSVDTATMEPTSAHRERSDVEAVPAARVVGEAAVAFEIARCYREKFAGDFLEDAEAAYAHYINRLRERRLWAP